MIQFGLDKFNAVWATTDGDDTMLPMSPETTFNGVSVRAMLEFLREVALEEYSKEGLTLNSDDRFEEIGGE